jgi:hypothetical protein
MGGLETTSLSRKRGSEEAIAFHFSFRRFGTISNLPFRFADSRRAYFNMKCKSNFKSLDLT